MVSRRRRIGEHRRLALQALGSYALDDVSLRFISDEENVTFCVSASEGDAYERFLLRIHRTSRQLRILDHSGVISSELAWIRGLRIATGLSVPEPLTTGSGDLVAIVKSPGTDGARICTLLRWMEGRVYAGAPRPERLWKLGDAMGRMHLYASEWTPPEAFARPRWDWETFFGGAVLFGELSAESAQRLLPCGLRDHALRVSQRAWVVMEELGFAEDRFGLIHADLHLRNVLFWRDEIRIIDFDDLGYGHWLYDLAVALCELRFRDDYEALRSALIEGYVRQRPLLTGELDYIDDFIAVRLVWFALWFTGHAQVNSAFRARLDNVHADVVRSLDNLARS